MYDSIRFLVLLTVKFFKLCGLIINKIYGNFREILVQVKLSFDLLMKSHALHELRVVEERRHKTFLSSTATLDLWLLNTRTHKRLGCTAPPSPKENAENKELEIRNASSPQ